MKFAASSAVFFSPTSLVASATIEKWNCPQGSHFEKLSFFPLTVSADDSISVSLGLNCPIMNFGIVPQFLDYNLQVPEASNNGQAQPIILARRTYNFVPGTIQPTDEFTAQIPHVPFVAGATCNVVVNVVYPIKGTDGSSVLVEEEVSSLSIISINA